MRSRDVRRLCSEMVWEGEVRYRWMVYIPLPTERTDLLRADAFFAADITWLD